MHVPMRLHYFTELAKHKGFGICILYYYYEPLRGESRVNATVSHITATSPGSKFYENQFFMFAPGCFNTGFDFVS
jgi:hypothetical protein